MEFHSACTKEALAWETELYSAFHVVNEAGEKRTVFRYQIPFSPDSEAEIMQKYGLALENRMTFYENMLNCIQHQMTITNYLVAKAVPSILAFTSVQQHQDGGVTFLYLEAEEIMPIRMKLMEGEVNGVTLLDILIRLCVVLRDINSEKVGVTHRGLALDEVYINKENKILLSGFYYSSGPLLPDGTDLSKYPSYLPMMPPHLSASLLKGERGSYGQDIQMLARYGWNIFSGEPYDAVQGDGRIAFPEYATEEIVAALILGLSGNDESCNIFRRKLLECRKQLNQTDYAHLTIPVYNARLLEYREEYVQP